MRSRLKSNLGVPALLSRRALLRWSALAGGSVLAAALPLRARAAAPGLIRTSGGAPTGALPDAIMSVMQKPRYASATWNLLVADLNTGQALEELNADQMAFTGSVRKLFSVGMALTELGADHRFTTAVYRTGPVDAQGTLNGNLVLVAAGDLTLGGRLDADGSIAFTDFDHGDANSLGTAILTPQDPLYGLDKLAEQALASGIRAVNGDVIIDDRLFQSFRVPNQNLLIPPIMVNENLVDVTVTPTVPGQAATIDWRPRTQAFAVDANVSTAPVGADNTVSLAGQGAVQCLGTAGCGGTLDGEIPVGFRAPLSQSPMLVQTFRMDDPPAFARTTFIEALNRAGVSVTAPAVAPNPAAQLPDSSAYSPETQVAQFVSPPFAQYAKLILKVSLNLGANLSLVLFGLARGQHDIAGYLAAERAALINEIGIDPAAFDFPTNGSGSPDSRATPRAVVQMLTQMAAKDVAPLYRAALPVLGADGSLADTGLDLAARGHVFAKPGTTIQNGQLVAQNLGGYIDAKSGRQLTFAVFVNNVGPLQSINDVGAVFQDEAEITNAIYEQY